MVKLGGVTALAHHLTIGQVAERSGVPHTTLRFYEDRGLISAERTTGNQRRYPRATLRRIAFIRSAQRVGLSLDDIAEALSTLPAHGAPTKADWTKLSKRWRNELDTRIDALQRLRDSLTTCIGCGCLSLRACGLFNQDDQLAEYGPGAPKLKATSEGGI